MQITNKIKLLIMFIKEVLRPENRYYECNVCGIIWDNSGCVLRYIPPQKRTLVICNRCYTTVSEHENSRKNNN